jgi:predicted HicB family RNase H-like nuclease
MDTLKYKGFIGSIEAELDDDTLYGKVLGLDKGTLVTYEGKTLAELKEDFINAVEDYIASCKEKGLPLHKSYTGSFNIRIPIELHAKAASKAQEEGISLNAFVKESLMQAVI